MGSRSASEDPRGPLGGKLRLRGEQESDVFSYLSRIEQNINDNGFTTRRATEQDLKKMLGVYFEQNVTTEKFEDFDGDRWVIVGE